MFALHGANLTTVETTIAQSFTTVTRMSLCPPRERHVRVCLDGLEQRQWSVSSSDQAAKRAIPNAVTRYSFYQEVMQAFDDCDWDTQTECLGEDPVFDQLLGEAGHEPERVNDCDEFGSTYDENHEGDMGMTPELAAILYPDHHLRGED